MDLSVVPYNHSTTKPDINESEYGDVVEPKPLDDDDDDDNNNNPTPLSAFHVKYGECMRNHAASIGGHANDGCGEFMPRADNGSRDSFTCAACGCHRNFHRRQLPGSDHQYSVVHSPPMLLYNAGSTPTTPVWDPKMVIGSERHHHHHHHLHHRRNSGRLIERRDHHQHHHRHDDNEGGEEREYDRRSETPEREEVQVQVQRVGKTTSYKRSRTKFTQEQKDRMLAFAEKIGWRIQRHDDVALNHFCSEVGVKRNVLKVWMHNNKNAHRRRESGPPPPLPTPLLPEAPRPQPPSQPVGV